MSNGTTLFAHRLYRTTVVRTHLPKTVYGIIYGIRPYLEENNGADAF